MLNLFVVFIGGGFGALLRHLLSVRMLQCYSCHFPYHTLSINVIGSIIISFVSSIFFYKSGMNPQVKLFLTVGLCGGFTTFSTFSIEAFSLLNDGKLFLFFLYIFTSVFLCVLGVVIGAYIAKYF